MTHHIITSVNGDQFEIHLRDSIIVTIVRHSHAHRRSEEVYYDDLPFPIRESLLISIIEKLTQNATQ